ncbi:alpha/beta fold hydrolase [Pseudooctadecabacter sp.]|uniref:alpha/beta fold hydrolase n=1 Tax=Pseudooctadecabacter sp. TaxID=1966338 RepID=UPI0035C86A16
MERIEAKGATLAAWVTGDGPPLVFAHSLGLDHSVWADVAARFPDNKIVSYDLRGHGQSDAPPGPYSMGTLVADAEAVCDQLALKDVCFIGLSVGGMIAQGLAVKRLDLVRAMVICSTAAKLGQPTPWHDRAATARRDGMAALTDMTFARWNEQGPQPALRSVFEATPPEGYAAMCEAIAGTDFYTPTSGLRLPTLGLCGDRDRATPPDLVRETIDLIPGSTFQLIRGAGHAAPATKAQPTADHIHAFLAGIGHI